MIDVYVSSLCPDLLKWHGDLNKKYREQREMLLGNIRRHHQGQASPKGQVDDLYSPLGNRTRQLPLATSKSGQIIENLEVQLEWVIQQTLKLWQAEGGQEAQTNRLLLTHEIQPALHDLAKSILWQRLITLSELSVLDKNRVFELVVEKHLPAARKLWDEIIRISKDKEGNWWGLKTYWILLNLHPLSSNL